MKSMHYVGLDVHKKTVSYCQPSTHPASAVPPMVKRMSAGQRCGGDAHCDGREQFGTRLSDAENIALISRLLPVGRKFANRPGSRFSATLSGNTLDICRP